VKVGGWVRRLRARGGHSKSLAPGTAASDYPTPEGSSDGS